MNRNHRDKCGGGHPHALLKACSLFVTVDTTLARALFLRVVRMTASILEGTARTVAVGVAFSDGHNLKPLVISRAVDGAIGGH